jgi:hypothetical protein
VIINHRVGFIFYHVAKAAGTSVQTALLSVPGSRRPRGTKHLTPEEWAAQAGWWQRWRTQRRRSFCFVRNPWERFGSAHRYIVGRGEVPDFPDDLNVAARRLRDGDPRLLALYSIRPQLAYARDVDIVGRFEALEEGFAAICRDLGIRAELPHANASGSPVPHASRMSGTTVVILAEVYRQDVEAFGYRPDR